MFDLKTSDIEVVKINLVLLLKVEMLASNRRNSPTDRRFLNQT